MSEREKVLIIDHEVDLCLLMKTYFLRKNYEVCIAHTFIDALPIARKYQPDFIFLDTAVCQNPEEDIKQFKQEIPGAKIIFNDHNNQSQFRLKL